MELAIQHDAAKRKFFAMIEGREAQLTYRVAGERTLDYIHTFVPKPYRGRKIGERIVKHALDYAVEHGYDVIATCPFVRRVIDQNPEYRNVTAEGG